MTKSIFTNPHGTLDNYTTIDLDDDVSVGEAYSISWGDNPGGLPTGYVSFENKFVEIDNVSGVVDIGEIIWHWNDTESAAYNEDLFELWKYNSSSAWENETAILNTTLNTLTATNLNPASTYGILESEPYVGCVNLSDPATWQGKIVNNSDTFYVYQNTTLCKGTYTSDVSLLRLVNDSIYLDCNDSLLIGPETNFLNIYGVYSNHHDSIILRNCNIKDFSVGIKIDYVNNSVFLNNFINESTAEGISIGSGCYDNTFMNNTANDNGVGTWPFKFGFGIYSEGDNHFINNTAQENTYLDYYVRADRCEHIDTFTDNIGSGGRPVYYTNNTVTWSDLEVSELLLCNASGSVLDNITVRGSDTLDNNAIALYYTTGATLTNINSSNNFEGMIIYNSTSNVIINLTADDNLWRGVYLYNSSENNLSSGQLNDNGQNGMLLFGSVNNRITNITACSNSVSGFNLSNSNYTTFIDNVVDNNGMNGFNLDNSDNNVLVSILLSHSPAGDRYLAMRKKFNDKHKDRKLKVFEYLR